MREYTERSDETFSGLCEADKVNILMVDDHQENLLALEAVLECQQYNLVRAYSGEEALRFILKEDFAVILLDVQMPGLNGFETAKIIKSREKSKNIPIIFITAINQSPEHVMSGYGVGAIDYILKPFQPETLKVKIKEFVNLYLQRQQLQRQQQVLELQALDLEEKNKRLKQQLEIEMTRLDRLNLVGEMAAGIAHEIRNPMTTIRGFLQMSKNGLAEEYIDLMLQELDRANGIISEFLNLARNKTVDKKQKDINEIIRAIMPLIDAEAVLSGKTIELDLNHCRDLHLDEKEIRQLILNLALNGLDSMEPGGQLTISTFERNGTVQLEVRDIGSGIPKEILDKLGTPFLTTKEKGTGLGLAVCYSIASRHEAKMQVNTSNKGTTFSIQFQLDKSPFFNPLPILENNKQV